MGGLILFGSGMCSLWQYVHIHMLTHTTGPAQATPPHAPRAHTHTPHTPKTPRSTRPMHHDVLWRQPPQLKRKSLLLARPPHSSFALENPSSSCVLLKRVPQGRTESDKGDFMSRSRSLYYHSDTGPTGPTALILRDRIMSSLLDRLS